MPKLRTKEQLKLLFQERKEINQRKREAEAKRKEKNKQLFLQKPKVYRKPIKVYQPQENPPPIKTKQEVKQLYEDWLINLIKREQLIKNKTALMFNAFMQESLKNMGRPSLKIEQIEQLQEKYQELLEDLLRRRKESKDQKEKDELTRQISTTTGRLRYYRSRLGIKEEKPKETNTIKKQLILNQKQQFNLLKEKALSQIAIAKQKGDMKEAKVLTERLEIISLRYKYSCG